MDPETILCALEQELRDRYTDIRTEAVPSPGNLRIQFRLLDVFFVRDESDEHHLAQITVTIEHIALRAVPPFRLAASVLLFELVDPASIPKFLEQIDCMRRQS
jgi:hypothetical protein